jgi:uncharacterized phage protein (TIGR02218 family)
MPLVIAQLTSWDHVTAALIGQENWAGSVTSMVTGWEAAGQAVNGPNTLQYLYQGSFDSFIIGVKFKPTAMTTDREIFNITAGAPGAHTMALNVTSSGFLKLETGAGSADGPWTSTEHAALVVGNWYNIEVAWFIHNTLGTAVVKLNGIEVPDLTQFNVDTQGTTEIGDPTPDACTMTNVDGQYDEFYTLVGGGAAPKEEMLSDTLGNPRIAVLRPDAQGDTDDWVSSTANPNKFEDIDDTLPDDGTSYISANGTSPVRQDWGLDNLPGSAVVAYFVSVVYRYHSDGIAVQRGRPYLRIAGVNYPHGNADEQWLLGAWKYALKLWNVSPASVSQFTVAEINSMLCGIERTTVGGGGTSNEVTQSLVEVLYATATAPTTTFSSAAGSLSQKTHHLSNLWKIERVDGVKKYYTDHNADLVFQDNNTYKAIGGLETSARQREINFKEPNLQVRGVLNSADITSDDIRAGRYRGAKVTEYTVDWRAPWGGFVTSFIYWIQEIQWSGSFFVADLSGIAGRLRHRVGRTYSRVCSYDLGDARCKVPIFSLTFFGVRVFTVSDTRKIFKAATSDIPASFGDDYFNFGLLTWTSGPNVGLTFQVKDYEEADREITLQLPTPFDVGVNDSFNIEPGCNKLFEGDCELVFANQLNYGGFPYLPGTDRLLQGPQLQ